MEIIGIRGKTALIKLNGVEEMKDVIRMFNTEVSRIKSIRLDDPIVINCIEFDMFLHGKDDDLTLHGIKCKLEKWNTKRRSSYFPKEDPLFLEYHNSRLYAKIDNELLSLPLDFYSLGCLNEKSLYLYFEMEYFDN